MIPSAAPSTSNYARDTILEFHPCRMSGIPAQAQVFCHFVEFLNLLGRNRS
jgi:hypothetical protein